jgi:hypothetical protein
MKVDVGYAGPQNPSLSSEFPNDNPALHAGVIWVCDSLTGRPRAERSPLLLPRWTWTQSRGMIREELEEKPPVEIAAVVEAAVVEAALVEPIAEEAIQVAEEDEGEGEILIEEMTPIDALGEVEHVEHVDLAPPTISEIVLIGARETDDEEIDEEPASLASLAALAAVATEIASELVPTPSDEISVSESVVVVEQLPPPAPDDPFTVLVCRLSDVAVSAGAPHVAAILPGLLFEGRLPESLEGEALDALRDGGVVVANEISPTFVSRTNAWREILRGTSDDFEAAGNVMLDEWAADVLARLLSAPQRATSLRQELRTRGVAAFGLVEAA